MSLRPTSPARLLAPMAAVVLALGAAACSDDDEAAPEPTTTTTAASGSETTDGEDDPGAPETEDTTADPDGTDGTGAPTTGAPITGAPTTGAPATTDPPTTEAGPPGALVDRLPDVSGYEREVDDDDASLDEGYCDGSTPSVTPIETAAAVYDGGSDDAASGDSGGDVEAVEESDEFYLVGLRFADDDGASTFYEEFASTTAGCRDEEFSADEGTPADIGDEAVGFEVSDGDDGGLIYIARRADVVWFYAHEVPAGRPPPAPEVLAAFTITVEG